MNQKFLATRSRLEFLELVRQFSATRSEQSPFDRALHRVLAADLQAGEDLPAGDRSAMDGYAVRAADTFGAGESSPAYLECVERIEVDTITQRILGPGECAWIPTGGFLPAGADAVVMVEYTEEIGAETIEVRCSATPGEHVMFRGEDAAAGQNVLTAGTRLRTQEIGLLAALGITTVPVFCRPRVAILSTGDEVVPVAASPRPGQIRDVNSYTTACLVDAAGGEPQAFGIVRDDLASLAEALGNALENTDAVLLSGGSSKGTRDHTVAALQQLPDAEILVHGVRLAPGKPTILARVGGKPVLGLPGQVGSAQVVMLVLGQPLIRHLSGDRDAFDENRRPLRRARLCRNIASKQGREDYVRVRLEQTPEGPLAHPVMGKSGLLRTLLQGNGLLTVAAEYEGLLAGQEVDVWLV